MGTVDFWVPVNRHRREPGGPHDTITLTFHFPTRRAPPASRNRNRRDTCFESGSKNGTRAVSVTTQKFPHFHPRGSGQRDLISASLVRTH